MPGKRLFDITGRRVGKLTVTRFDHERQFYRKGKRSGFLYYWLCKCDCGRESRVLHGSLVYGKTTTCGRCWKESKYAPGEVGLKDLFTSYKGHARNKGIVFEIDLDNFCKLTSSNCIYCGSIPNTIRTGRSERSTYLYNGLDRIDSSIGYITTNVVPCCSLCNGMKSSHNKEKFLSHIQKIAEHQWPIAHYPISSSTWSRRRSSS